MGTIPLKPGHMVGLSTRLRGGITYSRQELAHETTATGAEYQKWTTEKTVQDKAEHDEGAKVRGKIRSLVASACVWTPFSVLICPDDNLTTLDAKLAEATALRDAFNDTAQTCRVEFDCIRGRISDSTKDAAKAIAGEMRDLLDTLKEATASGDVASLRDVANKCRSMSKLMEDGSAAKTAVEKALAAARSLGRQIVKEVEKGAGSLQDVLSKASLAPIDTARFALAYEEEEERLDSDAPKPWEIDGGEGDGLDAPLSLYEEEEPEPAPALDIPAEPSRVVYDDLETEEELDPEALERFHREAKERLGLTSNVEPLPWHPEPLPFTVPATPTDEPGDLFRDVEQALEGKP